MTEPFTLQMNKVRDQIFGMKAPLNSLLKDVEPKFIKLGKDLQSVYTITNDLTKLTIETAKEIGGQSDENFLGQIESLASRSLNELKDCQSDISLYVPNIQNGSKHLEQLQSMSSVIKKISKSLNIVAMNIGVESSRSRECEEMFSMFAQEIRRLAKKIHEISLNIYNDSAKARSSQLDTLDDISDRQTRLEVLADTADKTVQESIQKIQRLISLSLASLKTAEEHAKAISHRIAEIVEAIQFQDIARQQLEHVTSALKDAEEICRKSCSSDDSNPGRLEQMVHIHSILDLQAAHISQVISQLDDVQSKVMKAFKGVGYEVEMLLNSGLDLEMENSAEEGFDEKFMALQSALERLNQLIGQGHGLGEQIEKTMRQSSEIVSRLSAHLDQVEDISMELHIKAINAVVMSKRLGGQGRTLEVLAQEVTEVSKESNDFVSEVVETLKAISEFAKVLSDCSWRREDKNNIDDVGSGMSLALGIDRISNVYGKLQKDASTTLEWSQRLHKIISRIDSDLTFLSDLKQRLLGLSGQIENAIRTLKQLINHSESDLGVDISLATQRYTMESERDVYRQVRSRSAEVNLNKGHLSSHKDITPGKDKEPMPNKVIHGQEKQDDLGENVEFF